MREETKFWIKYASENYDAAKLLLQSELFNPALQNIQQSVEKSLKAIFIENGMKLKKTHSINDLTNILQKNSIKVDLDEDECDLLDSIYLPTKYPIGSALPDFYPDFEITSKCLNIADKVLKNVSEILEMN